MTYKNLLEDSLKALPEFETEYEKNIEADVIDKESGMHIVFGYIFEPMLSKAIKQDRKLATKMFDFLEQMAGSEDVRVQEVCDQAVLEALYWEHTSTILWPMMKEKTRDGYKAVSEYMN